MSDIPIIPLTRLDLRCHAVGQRAVTINIYGR